ncbi:hypothetical protein N5K21_25935 [Rhizobium pusense]|uniref:Uncharacterized protein n=1 Tax=Agrobacterium pusense TaxID=648995 RepID=A0A6H0ZHY8_9HYPH|nr:hypothetical protein [Agrobacterium pusense]MDH2092166.1 hypothetical protein [Agrobacterium pusense]QIX19753.1 hypothetical protein FOB41_00845 [Agrobacterium pusense]WCK27534.1 hypothetical protein CFBP5496_0024445 [Agrobacterium pusense]
MPRSDGYRAFPVEDSEQNKIMQALDALAFKDGLLRNSNYRPTGRSEHD